MHRVAGNLSPRTDYNDFEIPRSGRSWFYEVGREANCSLGRHLLCRNVYLMETPESIERLFETGTQDDEIKLSEKHVSYIPTAPIESQG